MPFRIFVAVSSAVAWGGIRPTVAGKNKWARIETLQRNAAFLEAHELARLLFERGKRDVVFPLGMYLMVQRFGVAVDVAKN